MPLDLIFISPGNYTIEDNGIPGDGISVIKDGTGTVIFTFAHPADSLSFTVNTPGVNLTVNFTDSLGAANFRIGVLDDPAQSPDSITMRSVTTTGTVTLVSNGAIIEGGSDVTADIVAGQLILSAQTGVGTAGNALETQVGILEAETDTGGINLANSGDVQVGGLTDSVDGLDVVTSGNLVLTNIGSISLADTTGFEMVHGGNTSGNVTLTAMGASADIVGAADLDAIAAPGGNIALTADRDIALGTGGVNFDNDVRASGSVTVNAGRDFLIDGFADLASDGFGTGSGGNLVITAGRNIHVRNVTGSDASIVAEGSADADVILTTGFGGAVILDAPSSSAVGASSGDVIVNADRLLILGTSGISALNGQVILRPATDGREMVLGSASDAAFAVELSDAELDRIFSPTLVLGSDVTGNIRVIAPISPTTPTSLTLLSGTDISLEEDIITAGNLFVRAGDSLVQLAASSIIAGGQFFGFVDEVGDDGNTGATGFLGGVFTVGQINLAGNVDADLLTGSGGNDFIDGNEGADTLRGLGGGDTLDGGLGADTMEGGLGDDIFMVDNAGDVVVEAVGEGEDSVITALTHTLAANVENLTLTGAANVNGTGNALDNDIFGNSGDNVLNGLGGADAMSGGLGNDTFIVDNVGDTATDSVAGGTDLVQSSATFTLSANIENLTLTGGGSIDGTGNALVNILLGNSGNNVLNGLGGADQMTGGLGNDTYVIDVAGDVITEAAAGGTDTVQSFFTYALLANFENLTLLGAASINGTGNVVANVLTGNSGNNVLNGLGGADTMAGSTGNDTYVVDNAGDTVTEGAGAGTDTVQSTLSFTLGANVENLTLTGLGNANGTGNGLANVINGNAGANILDGAGGADNMTGGDGNDTFMVDNAGDIVIEVSDTGGTDRVVSSVTFILGNRIENLTLSGAGAINGTGNSLDNLIIGNGAANRINGGPGADTMQGGLGDDTFVVDNVADIASESVGAGTDTVESSVTFTLLATLENLTLTGAAAINGTGNNIANVLIGNVGANILTGLAGDDLLNGGAGADTMIGGLNNDTYVVDNAGDVVTEDPGAGTDIVQSSVSHTLSANVENLTLTGLGNANGTGNGLANVINGNAGANILDGAGGADAMSGGDGNDTFMVDNAGDTATEVSDTGGTDRVISTITFILGNRIENLTLSGVGAIDGTGNGLANLIIGNGAANRLNGAAGADTMQGGLGDDTYVVDNAGDVVTEAAAAGTDTVESAVTFTLAATLENLTLTGAGAINGTGNAAANMLRGNVGVNILTGLAGDDRLDGGVGADTMIGGLNNDTYVVDNAGDVVTENAGEGTDTVEVGFSYTLGADVENLTLTGLGNANGTGNGLANVISGNAGANILDGLGGADAMSGGDGNDTYMVDNAGDTATEASAAGGTDIVMSSVTFTLGANIERLTLTGAGAINGTGNTLANLMIGNGGNNVLNGLAGADTMQGGLGDDTYVVDEAGDVVAEGVGAGTDTVQSSISYTLGANLESLILAGSGNINGTGNSVANVLIGNVGANILDGAGGADTMLGGDGNDTYMVDNAGDIATEVSDTGGTDHVIATVTVNLGNRVENLTLAGAGAIDGNGNGLANMITGNGSANVLRGGIGADTLTGNGGNDRFRYDATADSTSAVRDDIIDFTLGDLIDLSVIDGNGAAAGNAFTFIGGGAFSGTAGELRVVNLGGSNFLVEGDTNGDSVADLVIDVTTIGGHILGAGDFVL